jgi:hypothetical protein
VKNKLKISSGAYIDLQESKKIFKELTWYEKKEKKETSLIINFRLKF